MKQSPWRREDQLRGLSAGIEPSKLITALRLADACQDRGTGAASVTGRVVGGSIAGNRGPANERHEALSKAWTSIFTTRPALRMDKIAEMRQFGLRAVVMSADVSGFYRGSFARPRLGAPRTPGAMGGSATGQCLRSAGEFGPALHGGDDRGLATAGPRAGLWCDRSGRVGRRARPGEIDVNPITDRSEGDACGVDLSRGTPMLALGRETVPLAGRPGTSRSAGSPPERAPGLCTRAAWHRRTMPCSSADCPLSAALCRSVVVDHLAAAARTRRRRSPANILLQGRSMTGPPLADICRTCRGGSIEQQRPVELREIQPGRTGTWRDDAMSILNIRFKQSPGFASCLSQLAAGDSCARPCPAPGS